MRFLLLLLSIALLAAACSASDSTEPVPTTQGEAAPTMTSTTSTLPATTSPPATSAPTTTTTAPTTTTTAPTTTTTAPDLANCPAPGTTTTASISVAGRDRSFIVQTPAAENDPVTSGQLRPAVLNFHGRSSSGLQQAVYSRMAASANPLGMVVVTPDAVGSPRQWLIEGVQIDEPASINFANALMDELISNYCINPDRIYATGFSSGGLMSSFLGCLASDRIAAIAPVALTAWDDELCGDAEPTPIMAFHGTADGVISFTGEPTTLVPSGRLGDVRENVASWAEQNGCVQGPTETQLSTDVLAIEWDCPAGADTILYVIEEGGHTWPGAIGLPVLGYTTQEIDATETITQFFAGQPSD
jgi:polyhydroxybutyrate depolymerase